ncbi:hypothetical protein ACGH2B_11945 [Streptomyces sp. BBFR2]|uniref:hypothetical protein n=1 Tax=Streptomyces sp. BBFR2 TaxID=3372854 RepID=UPI0037D9ADC8
MPAPQNPSPRQPEGTAPQHPDASLPQYPGGPAPTGPRRPEGAGSPYPDAAAPQGPGSGSLAGFAAYGVTPHAHSRQLPPYRGVVAVDAKDFTGYPAVQHSVISQTVPQILEVSFERAGLAEVWRDQRFPAHPGDGYVFGFDPARMPFLIHPWLNTLQEVLAEFNVHSRGVVRMRLRVSLHIGPLPDDGTGFDGNGTPRNDTHRLLDSAPVKAMLAAASEHVTHVAAILSDRCYEDAVAGGYTGRHRDHFLEVPATVEGKQFAQRGWLYVPAPSGNLYDRRIIGGEDSGDSGGGAARDTRDDQGFRDDREGRDARGGRDARRAGRRPGRTDADAGTGAPVTYAAPGGNLNTGTVHGGQNVRNIDVAGDYTEDNHVHGDRTTVGDVAGDYAPGGRKAGTVHGAMGDVVHGDKRGGE